MTERPTESERRLLERARELARAGAGRVSPNPLVGAVVVKDGEVVGEGYHAGPGQDHAEVAALSGVPDPAGATVVCTLEPCSHHGRTPPCVDALVAVGVSRVVIGTLDPLESGRSQGARVLRERGLEVAVADGPDEDACRELNSAFITWALAGRPEVTLKLATSLDGKIATTKGESQWITGAAARRRVHRMRAEVDAVAVGIGTALADDPRLTARDMDGDVRQPTRVVFDTQARMRTESTLALTANEVPVIVVASDDAPEPAVNGLENMGVTVLRVAGDDPARARAALSLLAEREIQSVLVEGGARLAGAILNADVVDRVEWMLAPMLIGGTDAPSALGDPGAAALADAPRLHDPSVEMVGEDLVISGRVRALPRAEGR